MTAGTWLSATVVVVEAVGTVARGWRGPGDEQDATSTHPAQTSALHALPPVVEDPRLVTEFHDCPCGGARQDRGPRLLLPPALGPRMNE